MSELEFFESDDGVHEAAVTAADGTHMLVRVVRDEYPDPPEFEYGCPVLAMDRWDGMPIDSPEGYYGAESWRHDGLRHSIREAWQRLSHLRRMNVYAYRPTVELVDRWLRIFYGGGCKIIASEYDRSGTEYVVYDTRAMREFWGQTGETLETSNPDATEWQAFLNGEVYFMEILRLAENAVLTGRGEALHGIVHRFVDNPEDQYELVSELLALDGLPVESWESDDGTVHGFYSLDTALESAEDELLAMATWIGRESAA